MNLKKRVLFGALIALVLSIYPATVQADFFGGDLPLLAEIVANTLQELSQMEQVLGTGKDTLGFLRDVNEGMREAMNIMRTLNQTMHPGVMSEFQSTDEMLRAIQGIYGAVPRTPEAKTQAFTDQSIAEAVTLHNQAFAYADEVDPEAERIKDYSRDVSPAGAGRLTAQSLGVLIHVANQILRTNAAMLKIVSEHLALTNRHEKIGSEQFKLQYEGLSTGLAGAASFRQASALPLK